MSIKYYLKVSEEKLFFTSDTHFFHKNIIKFCQRPFNDMDDMQEKLISNWNNTVPKDGIVFFLGDFAFGNSTEWIKIIKQLNGYIYFILGNLYRFTIFCNSIYFNTPLFRAVRILNAGFA